MPTDQTSLTPARLMQLMLQNRRLLLAPAIAGAILAAFSTLVLPRDWEARQGLLIRSEAAGYADQRLGKFTDLSEMKTVQETLLELARSQTVVSAVLTEVNGYEPSRQDIADFRDKLRLSPPGGAEFGKTEIFYIGVLDPHRDHAIAMVKSLTTQLDKRLNLLRNGRAESMVAEVERSVSIARDQLHAHMTRLSKFEQSVGADLVELRFLTNPSGGQSEWGQRVLAIESERRLSADRRRENLALLADLKVAQTNPERLLATPDALLESQPALRRLKNGLVDAQLTVARTAGVRTPSHPYVLAARRAQEAVRTELIRELPTAIAGVKLELGVSEQREAALAALVDSLRDQSAGLAGQRSQYAELVANVESQTTVLEGALKQLADAKAHRAGTNSASLLATIDTIETGANPVGPGRTTVTAAGGMAGLLLGATLVFLFHAPRADPERTPLRSAATQPVARAPAPPAASQPSTPTASPWAVEMSRKEAAFGYSKASPCATPPTPTTEATEFVPTTRA